jgi:hypothetical protein
MVGTAEELMAVAVTIGSKVEVKNVGETAVTGAEPVARSSGQHRIA